MIWSYNGLRRDHIAQRMVYTEERVLTTTVNDIQHIESTSYDGIGIIKVFFQPGVTNLQQPSPKSLLFRKRSCDSCHPGRRRL